MKPKYKPHDGSITNTIDEGNFNLSYMNFNVNDYEKLLAAKIDSINSLFEDYPSLIPIEKLLFIARSPVAHFRSRCRFGILHSSSNDNNKLSYLMWEEGVPSIEVIIFPIAVKSIYNTMRLLIEYISSHNDVLRLHLRLVSLPI